VQWLWLTLIQQELDQLQDHFNNHVVSFDKNKGLHSGISPNVAYALHEQHGGEFCLQPVDVTVAYDLMSQIGGACYTHPRMTL
jgi:hypothetical protein